LATHVFGNPCNVEKIEEIAKKYNLPVIFDSAHAFGVKYKSNSLFKYGDISTCSFHATKLFHTGEGGAIFCNNEQYLHKAYYSHNFGHNGPEDFYGLGINGKISELQAAMGLAVFPHLDFIISTRKNIVDVYNEKLSFKFFRKIIIREDTDWNYSYYPIIFDSEKSLFRVQKELNENNIFPRRYFYPSLNKVSFVNGPSMVNSEEISSRILCLPLSTSIDLKDIERICNLVNNA
jgi:dTDP-4-amino-4,6-dideoxygalactose transaminase